MVLIYNNNKFDVQTLHSYNSISFVADIICNETDIFPESFTEEDIIELFSKEDNMKLKTIIPFNFDNYSLTLIKDNLYSFKLFNNIEEENEEIEETNSINVELQLQKLNEDFKEKLKMGIMFPTDYGIQRFSFEEHDQQNLTNAYNYLVTNPEVEEYWYHANGEQMQKFSKEIILELYRIMIDFINEKLIEYHLKKQEILSPVEE